MSEQVFKPFPSVKDPSSLLYSFPNQSKMMAQSSVLPSTNHSRSPQTPISFECPFENPDLEPRPLGPSGFVSPMIETRPLLSTEKEQMKGMPLQPTPTKIDSVFDAMSDELFEPLPIATEQQDDPIDTLYAILDSVKARAEPIDSKQSRQKLRHQRNGEDYYSDEESIPRFRPYQEDLWRIQFKKLVEFKLKNGHCCVPHYYKEDLVLARWVKRQRFQYKKLQENDPTSTMTSRRIDELESIGFVWNSHHASWLEKLDELKAFKEMTGHCMVPAEYPENVQLSTWVKSQRRQYREFAKGKPSNMNTQRYQALKSLGFVFDVRKDK